MATKKAPPKIQTKTSIKIDAYKIISDQVDVGIDRGWHTAHKYTEKPPEDHIKKALHDAIMNELTNYLVFEEIYDR